MFATDRVKYFIGKYLEHKSILRSSLARVHTSPPHLVDVQWRLDYYLKVSIVYAGVHVIAILFNCYKLLYMFVLDVE